MCKFLLNRERDPQKRPDMQLICEILTQKEKQATRGLSKASLRQSGGHDHTYSELGGYLNLEQQGSDPYSELGSSAVEHEYKQVLSFSTQTSTQTQNQDQDQQ